MFSKLARQTSLVTGSCSCYTRSPLFTFLLLLLFLTCISQVAAAGGSPLPASAPHATVTCVHRVTDSVSSPITLIPRQRRSESETGSVAEVSGRGVNVAGPEAKQQRRRRRRVRRAFPPTLLTSLLPIPWLQPITGTGWDKSTERRLY